MCVCETVYVCVIVCVRETAPTRVCERDTVPLRVCVCVCEKLCYCVCVCVCFRVKLLQIVVKNKTVN